MTWPQGIFIGWLLIGLMIEAAQDGKPSKGTHKFGVRLIRNAVLCAVLYWGGFFSTTH